MPAVRTVTCPTCNRPVEWSEKSPYRPFCSERCKLIDLGAWASEQHTIPGEPLGDGQPEDPDHEPPNGSDPSK
ncbi:MAG: DNA gyrase inhibitor YacG [Proteobacteria bacterium]|nr:MAG: DNA gyrase inhibitor YacG [Pseudomonadota bacterium]